ncbi:MAG: 3'-5' exonuclease [Mycobacteriaceae bacterium]|nr:3'-5' exonuclease [Mycobacteriaceae bacterium]
MTVWTPESRGGQRLAGKAASPIREVIFIDTECTGMALDAEIWEFAAIRLRSDGSRHELHMFIAHDTAKADTLPEPFRTDYTTRCPQNIDELVSAEAAAAIIAGFVGINSVVVGAKPAYDSQRLATLFSRYCRRAPSWLNTMIDVCALAAGRLWASNQHVEFPLHSERLAHQLGICASDFDRHTAMGDVAFVEAIFTRCFQLEDMPESDPLNESAAA